MGCHSVLRTAYFSLASVTDQRKQTDVVVIGKPLVIPIHYRRSAWDGVDQL